MLDLFEYAYEHNVTIEIAPISRVPKTFTVRMRRDHCQMNTSICLDSKSSEDLIDYVLDSTLDKLEKYIRQIKHIVDNDCEVHYSE